MSTEPQARIEIERHVGPLSDKQWAWIVQIGFAGEVMDERETAKQAATKIKAVFSDMGSGPKGSEPTKPEMLTDERASAGDSRQRRREAVSHLLALEASRDEHVIGFRETHLAHSPANLLAWAEIEDWIQAKALEAGEPTWFLEVPIPTDIVIKGSNERRAFVLSAPVLTEQVPEPRTRWSYLHYGTPSSDYVKHARVKAGSVLDDLRKISEGLVARYSWRNEQATVFVLTGIVPLFSLARMTRTYRTALPVTSRIEISVDPMVTAEELAEYYRPFRQQMMPGKRNRPLDAKHTELAIFAAGRDPKEPWQTTLVAWNDWVSEEHKDWTYGEAQRRNFSRDIDEARDRLLNPPYVDPCARAFGEGLGTDANVVGIVSRVAEEVSQ